MVEIKELESWRGFEETLLSLFQEWKEMKISKSPFMVTNPLFRGQSDAS